MSPFPVFDAGTGLQSFYDTPRQAILSCFQSPSQPLWREFGLLIGSDEAVRLRVTPVGPALAESYFLRLSLHDAGLCSPLPMVSAYIASAYKPKSALFDFVSLQSIIQSHNHATTQSRFHNTLLQLFSALKHTRSLTVSPSWDISRIST